MSSRYQLLIFDWDGTLMDSVARIVSCMQQAARDCQLPVPADAAVRDIIGLSLRVAIPRLFPGLTVEMLDLCIDRYREHYLYLDSTPTPLFPGVAEQLACWHAAGYQLAVATGKARAGLERVLDETGLGHLFAARRGADEALSKPDPLMLQQLLEELDVPSHQPSTSPPLTLASRSPTPSACWTSIMCYSGRQKAVSAVLSITPSYRWFRSILTTIHTAPSLTAHKPASVANT